MIANRKDLPKGLPVVQDETRVEALVAPDIAAVASGTATLEAAIIGTPVSFLFTKSPLSTGTR